MDYYVYEDVAGNRATVHRANCRYCRYGKGQRWRFRTRVAWKVPGWHGPFVSRGLALHRALEMGRRTVQECSYCESE